MKSLSRALDAGRFACVGFWGDVLIDMDMPVHSRVNYAEGGMIYKHDPKDGIRLRPGGAANAATRLAGVGTACRLFGFVNEDTRKMMETFGVDTAACHDCPHWGVPRKTRLIGLGVEPRMDCEAYGYGLEEELDDQQRRLVRRIAQAELDALVLTDCGKGTVDMDMLIDAINGRSIPVVVDTKSAVDVSGPNTVVKIKDDDLMAYCNEGDLLEAITWVSLEDEARMVVTRGGECPLIVEGENVRTLEVRPRVRGGQSFSRIGTGDTFSAFLALFLSVGADLDTAVEWACMAATAAGCGPYRAPPLRPEVMAMAEGSAVSKILDSSDLAAWLTKRVAGKLLVTTGRFAPFGVGHAKLLECCRDMANYVLVILEPSQGQASSILAACEYVDAVYICDGDVAQAVECVEKRLGRPVDIFARPSCDHNKPVPGGDSVKEVINVPVEV